MWQVAIQMLWGDRGKYLGILTGIALSTLIMLHQPGILLYIFSSTYSLITDVSQPDIWVMDPKVRYVEDPKPLQDTQLYRVRGVAGVAWAVPFYRGMQKVRLADGELVGTIMVGLDASSLIGGPAEMVQGKLEDLRQPDAVIVDVGAAQGRLALRQADGQLIRALQIGDVIEINDKRARVVGIAKVRENFQSQPTVFCTYDQAKRFSLGERKLMSFVLAKAKPGVDPAALATQIAAETGLAAHTAQAFKDMTLRFFLQNTGILINFGFMTLLGFGVGAAVTGQVFYNFTLDNLRYFGVFKAMGASRRTLIGMILAQALLVGVVGFGLGAAFSSGISALLATAGNGRGFNTVMNWWLLGADALAVLLICMLTALLSLRKVFRLEPAVVFKG